MKIFKLPDLGEGLPDAIIREWYVKVGDEIIADEPMVAMETAKALVDVPAPFSGKVENLFGQSGDTISTGQPLVGFVGEGDAADKPKDAGTVVGAIQESSSVLRESATGVSVSASGNTNAKATPAVRALAKRLGVNLDDVVASGPRITADDVTRAANNKTSSSEIAHDMQTLSPARRAMVLSMTQSHQQIVPVTICDDADLHQWNDKQDISIRLIRALAHACETVPMLNATFDGKNLTYRDNKNINLGLAVDTPHGLYVPVLKDVANKTDAQLREQINLFKQQAVSKSIAQEDLHGATIMLSNFGAFAGRYANPIIVPPMVAIVGVGRSRDEVVAHQSKMEIHRICPLSVTIDHRLVTGGEAARFLQAMMIHLAAV